MVLRVQVNNDRCTNKQCGTVKWKEMLPQAKELTSDICLCHFNQNTYVSRSMETRLPGFGSKTGDGERPVPDPFFLSCPPP